MTEVTHISKDHGNTVFIGSCNHFVVADRAAWLNYTAHAHGCSGINTITEWEERIGSHRRTFNFETFITRFDARNFGRIDAAHLAR
ncbi:hypothetical protein NS226_23810, partial [Aureimonas ureilytica]